MSKNLNSELNPQQRSAVEHVGGPLLIAAGAGSGKTKTLTSRLAWLIKNGASPENIIAITFTNKAAQEMRNRVIGVGVAASMGMVGGLGGNSSSNKTDARAYTGGQNHNQTRQPFIGTFHSLGARILKQEAPLVKRTPNYTIYDEDDSLSLMKKTMKNLNLDRDKHSPADLHRKISEIKNELLNPDEFDDIAQLVFENYEAALVKNNAFDFDDLIEKVVRIFQRHPGVLEKYRDRFRYILVDEYQDINTAQYQMIRLLAQKRQNLSVVGDDQQAIYSFRGADFRNFLNFEEDWPNAKVIKLEQNYRSTGTIITAASEVIKNNKLQKPKTLWTENKPGSPIKVVRAADPEEEADFVAEQVMGIAASMGIVGGLGGNSSSNKTDTRAYAGGQNRNQALAILYRTNAQSRALEQALISANIPYKIFGGVKFYERKEIKDLLAGLRLAANPQDTISAERLAKNFDKKTAEHLLKELPRLGEKLGILELINFFLINADYFDYLEKNHKNHLERIENINELIRFAGEFQTLSEFLERVALLQSTDAPARSATHDSRLTTHVNLMTIHLAKGLEFDYVFVTGCGEGLLPHQMSYGSLDELEEERRLMYVAMTRAKKELCISFANTPSRFLYEIPPELIAFTDLKSDRRELPGEEDMYID